MSSVHRQGGTGATCPHAHPFCANGADVGKGGAGGRRAHANVVVQTQGNGPRAPYLHAKGRWRSMRGTEWRRTMQEKGKRWAREAGGEGVLVPELAQDGSGPCGGSKSCLPLLGLLYSSRPPRPPICAHKRTGRHSPPSPASCAAVRAQKAHYDKGRMGHSPVSGPPRSRGPAAPQPLPSQHLPHSHGKGAHEGMSPRSLPAGAQRTSYPPQSPSAQVMPAQLHTPRPARIRERKEGVPTPLCGPHQPNPTCPTLPAYTRGWTARPAPPCPRTQGEGQRAQPSPPRRGRHQPNPTRPARIHERRDGVPPPLRTGHTSPAPHPPHTQGGGSARQHPLHRLCQPSVYAPRHTRTRPGMQEGQCTQPPLRGVCYTPRPRRGACNGEGHMHTREGGTRNEGRCNPSASGGVARRVCGRGGVERNPGGGAAHEQKDRHIGVWAQKGESDGEGVVNEAKQSQGKAARTNGRHPTHTSRLT
ncbi:hypothetical protein EDB86DRAFT_2833004 [Lactarius hatsudake]|nr:hypothetical protein EDB86DRAFT_2833004 [Lactarius hatsudake]